MDFLRGVSFQVQRRLNRPLSAPHLSRCILARFSHELGLAGIVLGNRGRFGARFHKLFGVCVLSPRIEDHARGWDWDRWRRHHGCLCDVASWGALAFLLRLLGALCQCGDDPISPGVLGCLSQIMNCDNIE